ncbi:MAG: hypothetical protein ACYTBJ_00275 [Planctomycetota bacterium]|jgi:hypothetical protein
MTPYPIKSDHRFHLLELNEWWRFVQVQIALYIVAVDIYGIDLPISFREITNPEVEP